MALLSKKGRTRRLALPRRQKRVLLCGLTLLAAAGLVLLCTRILRSWMGGLGGSGTVAAVGLQPLRPPAAPLSLLPREIWAGGALPAADDAPHPDPATVRSLLKHSEVRQLMALCGRCLTHSLTNVLVGHDLAQWVFVSTGDIPDEWIRDAAVQMGIYLPRVARQPALRRLIEGAIRTQAFFITQDPYANSFNHRWRPVSEYGKGERLLGRGGWVASRNYEMDSGAYFINFLHNYWTTPGVVSPEQLLSESLILDAVALTVHTWAVEQRHEQDSPYRYSELPRKGLGPPVAYTGMTWTGFRPSDDPATHGYSIPSNAYAAGALQRVLALNAALWGNEQLAATAAQLLTDIEAGIQEFGVVEVTPGVEVYAYEVDGLGGVLADFDDANLPSLLAMPLLGWDGYNRSVYAATRRRLLDPGTNPFYFVGRHYEGIGSPHTPSGHAWPLAVAVAALTSPSAVQRAASLRTMLTLQCGNGLMHESVHVDDLESCTRPVFEWANAMLVTLVERTLGTTCDDAAEAARLGQIAKREGKDSYGWPENGGPDDPRYYESLLAHVAYDSQLQQPANTFEEERTAAEDGGDGSGDADAYGDIDLAGAHELEAEEAAQRQRQWRQRQWRQRDQVVHRQEGGGISIVQRGKLSPPVT